jgi:hypothetical protein
VITITMSSSHTPQRENTNPLAIPRVLASLKDLIVVEETNEERIKLNNKVAWFHDVSTPFTSRNISHMYSLLTTHRMLIP